MFSAVQPRREGFPLGYGACGKTKGTQTMTIALIFWVSMLFFLLSLVGSTFFGFAHYAPAISSAFIFWLFLLVGWKLFGRPIVDA